jgi:hypothetical protein
MTKNKKGPQSYVKEVTEGMFSYIQELNNELQSHRDSILALETEKAKLQNELDTLHARTSQPSQAMAQQYAFIKEQNANLANLYVASYRLHETLSREDVLTTIQEILANMVGSEEIGIFERDPAGEKLTLLWSSGLDEPRYRTLSARAGLIGRSTTSGEIYLAKDDGRAGALPHEDRLTACVPLKLNGNVTGAIAVFGLLQQKPALTRVDEEVFELLATHAATALYCTELHARAKAEGTR